MPRRSYVEMVLSLASNKPLKGRGALSNGQSRYLATTSEWLEEEAAEETCHKPPTELIIDKAKSIIATNSSPDVPFDQSVNPYKGCEHGCIYCFARPTHAYWDLSPGLDFETKIFYKPNGPELLERAIDKPNYICKPLAFGTNTDPYQPIDQQLQITRQLLQVLQRFRHPFSLVTKGSHVLRDLDIFADMAADNLCSVRITITTLSNDLKRTLEPRAASARTRLEAVKVLHEHKVPVGILMAPVIPMINDMEIEQILEASAAAGARSANHLFIRLPLEVRDLFYEWLHAHFPERAKHVISLIRQSREGADYTSEFGTRMRGNGVFAELIAHRFAVTCKRFGLTQARESELTRDLFIRPSEYSQLSLF